MQQPNPDELSQRDVVALCAMIGLLAGGHPINTVLERAYEIADDFADGYP